ncbi:MAG TPA: peptidase [Candidatus Nitrosotenuis sp.]|nr:peptidase [Candidatus Nitrosotenuis sp.]
MALTVIASSIPLVSAEVWIPEDEFQAYYDSAGVYTVVGVVRNRVDYPVLPTVTFTINEGGNLTYVRQEVPTVFPHNDIPFKLKFPQITSKETTLENPSVEYVSVQRDPSGVQIIYDKTLVKHPDGHLSGKIVNTGNATEYNIKVYATIHGNNNKFLDAGKNNEKIPSIAPGQVIDFTINPDPMFASDVDYYSCFAIGDETVVPLYATRNGERFDFRYDSTAAFTVVGFDESGTKLTMEGINSFKLPTFVNFEFPRISDNEKFQVYVNDESVKFIQSQDEWNNWHVAFNIEPASQYKILITGFEPKLPSSTPSQPEQTMPKVNDMVDYLPVYVVLALAAAVAIGLVIYKSHKRKTTA